MTFEIEEIIKKLTLKEHPEGGYYNEVFRSEEKISVDALPSRYNGDRNYLTVINFLITKEKSSYFHKVASDEQWYFHEGGTAIIHLVDENGVYFNKKLGSLSTDGASLFFNVPKGYWFGVEVIEGDYALFSCSVAPGFEFEDFELAEPEKFIDKYPKLKDVSNRLLNY